MSNKMHQELEFHDPNEYLTAWDRAYNEVVKDLAARVGWDRVTMEQARWDASLLVWQEGLSDGEWHGGPSPSEPSTLAKPIAEELGFWPPTIVYEPVAPLPADQWMLNQPCQPEMMQSPPLHYTQSLDEATQDFQDLILARNVPRVSQSLNPHANEFQATQVITQASNNTTSPTTQPIAQALNNTTRPAPQSNASFANVTMYDVAYRLERLEAEVSELRLELQEHVESPTSRNKNGKSERDMREAKLLEKMMLQQPVPLKHTEQFDDRAGLGTMVEDSNQLEHPKQFNDRAALGAMVGESRQVHNDAGSDDLIML